MLVSAMHARPVSANAGVPNVLYSNCADANNAELSLRMDTVHMKRISDALVELNVLEHGAHTATIQTVFRSPVLTHVLQASEGDGSGIGSILVPTGYLVAWLSHVHELQATITGRDHPEMHNLLVVLKASDFFADEGAVQDVAAEIGKEVFRLQEAASRCPARHRSWLAEWKSLYECDDANTAAVHDEATPADMIFDQLSHNLVISIVQGSELDLCHSIILLPKAYHTLALQAHFPAITRDNSLSIPEASLSGAVAAADVLGPTLDAVASFTCLRTLQICTPVHSRVSDSVGLRLQGALLQLHSLQDLHLEGGMVRNEVLEAVAFALAHCKPKLRSVALHRVGEMQDSVCARPLTLQTSAIFDSLKLCARLQSISLRCISCRRGSGEDSSVLSPDALLDIPSLTSLSLADGSLTAENLEQMVHKLQCLQESQKPVPHLEVLNLRMNRLRDHGMKQVARLAGSMPSLQEIDVSWNEMTSLGCTELGSAFSALRGLRHLHIGGNLISDGLPALAEALRDMRDLQHLNMISCGTSSLDGWMLGTLVGRFSALTYLDLRTNSLGGGEDCLDGLRALSASLSQISSLQELRLSIIDRLFSDGLRILLPGISQQPELQTLQLKSATTFAWRLFWFDQTLKLAHVLRHFSKLSKLENLSLDSGVQLSGEDARALVDALPVSLRNLHLRFMPDLDSQQQLSATLSKLTALVHLNLSDCGFMESSAAALSDAILCMPNLTHLCLRGNNLRDGGAIELAAALRASRSLQEVDLTDTGLSEIGAIAIVGAADEQGKIISCRMQDNRIIRSSLPKRSRRFQVVLGSTRPQVASLPTELS